jgi:hypothetical protein
LSRARYAIDEKLAWEGEVDSNEDDVFFTPPESPQRKDPRYNVISNTQAHLEVNGAMHAYIVKQLTNLEIVHSLGFPTPKRSRSKQSWKSIKVIKIGGNKSPSISPRFDHS